MHEVFLVNGSGFVNIQDVYLRFPTEASCFTLLEKIRWNGVPQCPYCRAKHNTALHKEYRYHCNKCNTTFSVTVQTVFHHTHLPLQKWFLAISLLLNARKSVTTRQLAQDLEVNKNTAWYVGERISKAMLDIDQRDLIQGLGVTI